MSIVHQRTHFRVGALVGRDTNVFELSESGIVLVTLTDGKVYRGETISLVDMITSLVIMERAHEESKTKGLRVGAAWKQKRVRASQGQPMTARCPAWLRLALDRRTYELIPDRAEIVRQIFADSAGGLGMYSIATRLNKAGVPAFVGKMDGTGPTSRRHWRTAPCWENFSRT